MRYASGLSGARIHVARFSDECYSISATSPLCFTSRGRHLANQAPGVFPTLPSLRSSPLVETAGLEPAALCLQGRRSSYDELGPRVGHEDDR